MYTGGESEWIANAVSYERITFMANTSPNAAPPRSRATSEWTLCAVAASCSFHPIEEYSRVGRGGLPDVRHCDPDGSVRVMNGALLMAAVCFARIGWRQPTLGLIIPAATPVNAVFFHILPTAVQHKGSAGVIPPTLLHLPFSSCAFLGLRCDGVTLRAMVAALVGGTLSNAGRGAPPDG